MLKSHRIIPTSGILLSALEKAGLTGILNSTGTYTVFTPNDAAFQNLFNSLEGVENIDDLESALGTEAFADVLLYHVLGTKVKSSEMQSGYTPTLSQNANSLSVSLYIQAETGVSLNKNTSVTNADIEASNGIIHKIDQVLMPPTVVNIAEYNDDFSELVDALGAASGDLISLLSGEGPFTVFAPNNAAFEAIADVVAGLTAGELEQVLLYHVVAGSIPASSVTEGEVTSSSGKVFTIAFDGTTVTIADVNGAMAQVILTDVIGTNGVVHVIDKVLIPFPEEDNSIAGIAASNADLSILVDALQRTNLVTTLSGTGNFTVFAPTNDAFSILLNDMGYSDLDELENALGNDGLRDVLLYHVLGTQMKSSEIQNGYVSTLSENASSLYVSLLIQLMDNKVMLNGSSEVTTADIQADNGVIHLIDKVISLPTVLDIATQNNDFSELVAAVEAAPEDVANTLSGNGPYTVFAPNNAAFEAIADIIDGLTAEDLKEVLFYHTVAASIPSSDVAAGEIMTALGKNFTITIGETIQIEDVNGNVATIIATDIVGTNGVVHVIDKVLIPFRTILDIISEDPKLSTLVEALQMADLDNLFAEEGNYTLFAPTNDAFQGLLDDLGLNSLAEVEMTLGTKAFANALLYHVLGSKVTANQISHNYVSTLALNADDLNISLLANLQNNQVMINGSGMVEDADIQGDNGVVHIIDKVILPPTIYGFIQNDDNFSQARISYTSC